MRALIALVAVMTIAACGGGDDAADPSATELTGTTASPPATAAPTTSEATATTETTGAPPITISRLPDGYHASADFIVATVADGIDQGAGGLAVDADAATYTSDFGYDGHVGNTITRIAPDGTTSVFVTDETMTSLTGSTFGPDGTLYQSGFGSGQVFAITPDGTTSIVTDQIAGPSGVVATPDGRLFVESCTDDIIYEVLVDGTAVEFVQDPLFACLNGLTQDADGNLYAVNFQSGRLFLITPAGEVTTLHEFPGANAHVAHRDGQLFVTSRTKHVVFRYDLASGVADIVVGTGAEGHVDGPGPEAQIERPNTIVVGSDGTLYINHGTDRRNHPTVVRAIRPAG